MKIGILIVAYNATSTLVGVLNRISNQVWDEVEEVVVFDDASADDTYELAVEYQHLSKRAHLKVFRNKENLGYGGNQKNGYRYLIDKGLDIVVLLHGDGQYAPEYLEQMYSPIVEGEADAVFGTRFNQEFGGPRNGGMPLYKFLGNRVLTVFENHALGVNLSEFHSGYRAYSLHALKNIDMSQMTDDFHFDTEIIIKLFHQGFRIKEIPIPTYYGDELCYVDGMRYAKDVFRAVTRYKRTVRGIQSYPEFREFFPHYPVRKNQFSSHHWLKSLSGSGHQILDIGCGEGELAQELAEQNEVVGVDILSTPRNRGALKDYVQIDLENGSLADNEKLYGSKFDRILLPDVLEHLRNPEKVLSDCQELLAPDGRILVSLPNVANITVRFSLLFGRWSYSDRGILDKTHVRFYTRKSGKRLIEGCGYRVVQTRTTIMPITMLLGLDERGAPAKLLSRSLNVVTRLLPGLMGYQLIYEAVRDEAL